MIYEIVIALTTGVIAGTISGMLGVGGGTITVPIMVLLLKIEQHTAQGVALCAMLFAALIGTIIHYRQRMIDIRTALIIAPTAVIFSILGAKIAGIISAEWLTRIFAIVLLTIGCRMLLFNHRGQDVGTN